MGTMPEVTQGVELGSSMKKKKIKKISLYEVIETLS